MQGLGEATVKAAKEAVKTLTFFIIERSPLSIVVTRRNFQCHLSSPHLLDIQRHSQGDEEKKDEMMTTRLKLIFILFLGISFGILYRTVSSKTQYNMKLKILILGILIISGFCFEVHMQF